MTYMPFGEDPKNLTGARRSYRRLIVGQHGRTVERTPRRQGLHVVSVTKGSIEVRVAMFMGLEPSA
jgi:hypothetical protein